MTEPQDTQTQEEAPQEENSDGVAGCLLVGGAAAIAGARNGAIYGYRTGMQGAFAGGPFKAFFKVAGTTVLGAVVGGVGAAAAGCAAGYAGEKYMAEDHPEGEPPIPPQSTPKPASPPKPEWNLPAGPKK